MIGNRLGKVKSYLAVYHYPCDIVGYVGLGFGILCTNLLCGLYFAMNSGCNKYFGFTMPCNYLWRFPPRWSPVTLIDEHVGRQYFTRGYAVWNPGSVQWTQGNTFHQTCHLVKYSTKRLLLVCHFGDLRASFLRVEIVLFRRGNSISQVSDDDLSSTITILAIRCVDVVSKGCHSGHKLSSGFSSRLVTLFCTIYLLGWLPYLYLYCLKMVNGIPRHIGDPCF